MDKIAVLLAAYNGAPYIDDQIDSIIKSGASFSVDLIVGVDPSDDDTLDIVRRKGDADTHIEVIQHRRPSGSAKNNFSRLLEFACGEDYDCIFLSDQDDIWLEEKIPLGVAAMKDMELRYGKDTPLLFFTDSVVVDDRLGVINPSFWNQKSIDPSSCKCFKKLLISNVVQGSTSVFNSSLLRKSIPVPEEAMMHDWWLALVAVSFGKISYSTKSTMLYRQHGSNVVGADKTSLLSKITKAAFYRETYTDHALKVSKQAECFFQRYSKEMNGSDLEFSKDFVCLKRKRFTQRAFFVFRCRSFFVGVYTKFLFVFFYKGS